MQNPKVFRLLVGKDVDVSATGLTPATATDGSIVPFTEDWAELLTSDTIATSPIVYLMQKVTNASDAKIGSIMSLPIHGQYVRNYKGESFRPGAEQVTYIGLAASATTLAAGTGDVTATVGDEYQINILNAEEKEKVQVPSRYYYILPTGGTKYTLLVEFARQINADENCVCTARVVGNGTGTDGLTSATAYGLQLKAKDTKYFFSVGVSDSFGATVTYDTEQFRGEGTVSILEAVQEVSQGNLGYYNRLMLPKTITNYVATQANSAIATTGATDTATFTQNSKVVTTATGTIAAGALAAGDKISVAGVEYCIESLTTGGGGIIETLTLTEPFKAATVTYTASGSVLPSVTKVEGYDVIVIDHDVPVNSQDNQNIHPKACRTIVAIPSKLANATAKTTFLAAINAWALTTPGAFANVSV